MDCEVTPVQVVSIVLQGLILVFSYVQSKRIPVYPAVIQDSISLPLQVVALIATGFGITLNPAGSLFRPWCISILLLATLPPLAGLVELKARKNGRAVFNPSRFWPHLITNSLGAVAAVMLVWAVRETPGLTDFLNGFASTASFNLALPVVAMVIFAFVRVQQVDECPDIDQRAKSAPDWEDAIPGSSLRHVHQWTNVLYLIYVTFTAAIAVLILFAQAMESAKAGSPLQLRWQNIGAATGLLAFMLACGLPKMRVHRAVWFTFLTGTPGVLGALMVWFALFEQSTFRDVSAGATIGLGYVSYCVLAVMGTQSLGVEVLQPTGGLAGSLATTKQSLQLHYFSALIVAGALFVLFAALYAS